MSADKIPPLITEVRIISVEHLSKDKSCKMLSLTTRERGGVGWRYVLGSGSSWLINASPCFLPSPPHTSLSISHGSFLCFTTFFLQQSSFPKKVFLHIRLPLPNTGLDDMCMHDMPENDEYIVTIQFPSILALRIHAACLAMFHWLFPASLIRLSLRLLIQLIWHLREDRRFLPIRGYLR